MPAFLLILPLVTHIKIFVFLLTNIFICVILIMSGGYMNEKLFITGRYQNAESGRLV